MKAPYDKTPSRHRRHVTAWSVVGGAAVIIAMGNISPASAQAIGVTVNGQPVQFQDIGPQQIERADTCSRARRPGKTGRVSRVRQ